MHFFVVKSRSIKIFFLIAIVCVLLSVSFCGGPAASVYFGNSSRRVPVYCVETENKQVAISFDSAWGAEKTQGILDILKEYNVSATFFLVGFWVDEHSDMVEAINNAEIEIGCHSNSHPDMTKLSKEQMREELSGCVGKIENITGKKVDLFRAPFGAYNNMLIETCDELSLLPIQWDVDTLDWKGLSAKDMTARVMSKVKNGSIILMHNNSDNILSGLRMILDRLKLAGYTVSSVGDLVYRQNYSIDKNGVQRAS